MQAFFPFRQAIDLVSIREHFVACSGNIRVADASIVDIEATFEEVTFSEKKVPELRLALRTISLSYIGK